MIHRAVGAAEKRGASGRGACARGRAPTKRRGGLLFQAVSNVTGTALQAPTFMPSVADVMRAVVSLYDDELRPYSRILRKRIIEQSEARGIVGADCDAGRLKTLCESMGGRLRVQPEDGGEWSALLTDRAPNFVDIYNEVDDYPEEVWRAAEAYFKLLGESNQYALPGGRYASAQALVSRKLDFLKGYTVGQVCHFTQIAVSQRKLLGYADGAIVPYSCSTSMAKTRCAQQQRPLTGSAKAAGGQNASLTVADWTAARAKLRQILASAVLRGSDNVPLSNVKRLFRSQYQMELSETALGHTKLTELLQDLRFGDICEVKLQDRGYVVVPVHREGDNCNITSATNPQQWTKQATEDSTQSRIRRQSRIGRSCTAIEPLMRHFGERLQPLEEPPPVQRTFIHFQLPCPSSAVRRTHSQPCHELLLDSAWSLSEGFPRHTQSDPCPHEKHELAPKPALPLQNQGERVRLWSDEPLIDSEDEEHENWARDTEGCDASKRQTSWASSDTTCHDSSMPSCRMQLTYPEDEALPHKEAWSARAFPLSTPSPLYGNTVAFQMIPASSPEKSTPANAERTQPLNSLPGTQLCHDEPPRFPRFTMPVGNKEVWTPVASRAGSKATLQQPSYTQALMQSRGRQGRSEAAQVLKLACRV